MNINLLEKFLNNNCTAKEVKEVLKWFDTPEGTRYLEDSMDLDIERVMKKEVPDEWKISVHPETEKIRSSIYQRIGDPGIKNVTNTHDKLKKRKDIILHLSRVAAVLLVAAMAFFFSHFISNEKNIDKTEESVASQIVTSDGQQKRVTLSDGSTIRLNRYSEVRIAEDYMSDSREVELKGEAYFEVTDNAEKPFIVHTNGAMMEVLGTAFSVKALKDQDNIQVAVIRGSVLFSNKSDQPDARQSAIVDKGQFGYLDISENRILVEEENIDNYLAWMRGRLVFDELSFDKVCLQLERILNLKCSFEEEKLKDRKLTADFSHDSLKKTLDVISMSLDLEYSIDKHHIIWSDKN